MEMNTQTVIALSVLIGGWVLSVERRIWGFRSLHKTLNRVDRRTFALLMRLMPADAAKELQARDSEGDD